MKSTRFVLMLLVVLSIAAVANAQCMMCENQPGMPPSEGICVETSYAYCTSVCCWSFPGADCPVWDSILQCGWMAKAVNANRPMIQRAVRRNEPAFTSRLLLERNATLVHRRMSRCSA